MTLLELLREVEELHKEFGDDAEVWLDFQSFEYEPLYEAGDEILTDGSTIIVLRSRRGH